MPGVGNINNGMVQSGQNGTPEGLIQDRGAHFGPRLGIAYQLNSKTVFRMGGGVFYERVATFGPGITSNYTTNPPDLRTATLYYGNVANIASSPGTFFPTAINQLSSDGHVPTVYNYNVGIQRELPWNLFAEVSYVGAQSRHLWLAQPFNLAPFGSAWQPTRRIRTVTPKFDGTTNLPVNMYRPYAGYTNATDYTWGTYNNYNALQTSLNRRVGRASSRRRRTPGRRLWASVGHITDTRTAGYGPLPQDRTQSLVVNYIYNIPACVKHRSWTMHRPAGPQRLAALGLDQRLQRRAGQRDLQRLRGRRYDAESQDHGKRRRGAARGLHLQSESSLASDRNIDTFINTSCFAPAQKGSIGLDSGYDRLRGPGLQNWDMSLFKNIPFKERRAHRASPGSLQRVQSRGVGHVQHRHYLQRRGPDCQPADAARRHRRTIRIRCAEYHSRQQPAHSAGGSKDLLLI